MFFTYIVADKVREKTFELLSPGHQQVWSGLDGRATTDTTSSRTATAR